MSLQAGFAEVDITPNTFPVGTYWGPVGKEKIADPLFAHASVFNDGVNLIAFLSLDIVIIEREYVEKIRELISRECPVPANQIMISATHNHACPAVVDRPWSPKDHDYLNFLTEQGAKAVVDAYRAMVPVETGTDRCYEGRISFNRRFIMKNGSVISQPNRNIMDKDVLFGEGIIDPEVGVLCARDMNGKITGMLVNFACHAVHQSGSLSAGFPGELCAKLKESYGNDCVCVFLNGACGNVIHKNFADPDMTDTKERTGSILADDVKRVVSAISYSKDADIAAESTSVSIRYRSLDGLEKNLNNLKPFNVFPFLIQKDWYKWSLEKLRQLHAKSDHEDAEIQVFRIGETFFGAIPAEYFSQHALRIKEQSPAARTFVVSLANGWLGYIPHKAAFDRIGGHESTWCFSSKMEPNAGDMMADAMLETVRKMTP